RVRAQRRRLRDAAAEDRQVPRLQALLPRGHGHDVAAAGHAPHAAAGRRRIRVTARARTVTSQATSTPCHAIWAEVSDAFAKSPSNSTAARLREAAAASTSAAARGARPVANASAA